MSFLCCPPLQECKTFHGMFVGSACGPHGPYVPDVLFWCVVLFFTTFFLSSFLKQFKTKRYFPTKVTGLNFGSIYVFMLNSLKEIFFSKKYIIWVVVVHAFNPITRKADTVRAL